VNLLLQRDPSVPLAVTYGVLNGAGGPYQTLELPFRLPPVVASVSVAGDKATVKITQPAGSAPRSCVPPGIYNLERHNSPDHPFTWALVNEELGVYHEPGDVPPGAFGARSAILLHTGNSPLDTKGCIIVGSQRTGLFGLPGVLESIVAFEKLKAHLPWVEGHTLTIMGQGATPP
jgi:hypothetical protein